MKRFSMVLGLLGVSCLAIAGLSSAWSQEKPKMGARAAVERYVASALAGKVDEAAALAVAGQSPSKKEQVEAFREIIGAKALKIATVFASAKAGQAIAVSEAVKLTKANPDGSDRGAVVFALVSSGDQWLVKDIDFRSADGAKEKVKGFEKKHPDAKEVPATPAK